MGVDEILISTLAYLMKKFSGLSVNATHGATFNNFQLILPHQTRMANSSIDDDICSSSMVHDVGSKSFSDPKAGPMTAECKAVVKDIAADAKIAISVLKLDVVAALHDTQMTHMHLVKYKEFIEKKKKQRLQCIRDMQSHCCQCDGPHISKPPFRHGNDVQREPVHSQYQAAGCQFLQKKQAELNWLDTTLGNYNKNNEQHELEIEKCKAETQRRKEHLKEALANSLRLMEIASDDLQSYPESHGIQEIERPTESPSGAS